MQFLAQNGPKHVAQQAEIKVNVKTKYQIICTVELSGLNLILIKVVCLSYKNMCALFEC